MNENPPPAPQVSIHSTRVSFNIYTGEGPGAVNIGYAVTTEEGHSAAFFLGAGWGEEIHLRATGHDFHTPPSREASFHAFMDGERVGTAFPHEDGKGHRMKLNAAIPDDSQVELRPAEPVKKGRGKMRPGRARAFRMDGPG